MKRIMRMQWLFFASFALTTPAFAAIVTLDFTGSVYSIDDRGFGLDGSISVGTPWHIQVVYDESAAPSGTTVYSPTLAGASWMFTAPPNEMTFAVGSYTGLAGPLGNPTDPTVFEVGLTDGSGGQSDGYSVAAFGPVTSASGNAHANFTAGMIDSTGSALSSLQLASVPFDLASWDPWSVNGSWSRGQIILQDDSSGAEAAITGRLEHIAVDRVPEPGTALFVAAPFAALRVRTRF